MKRMFLVAVATLGLAMGGGATAERITFTAPSGYFLPYTGSLSWPSQDGFLFGPFWDSNNGRDSRNAPYIPGNMATLTSTFGAFTFNEIELGGSPWEGFGMGRSPTDNPIPLTFYGPGQQLLTQRFVTLPGDDTFVVFSERIEGVQSLMIGASTFSTIKVRLNSITINEPEMKVVPEPHGFLLAGLSALAFGVVRRRCKRLPTAVGARS
jgi:hypothetical protein